MRFEIATATRIIFGPGTVGEVGSLAKEFGGAVLIVTGSSTGRAEPLFAQLHRQGVSTAAFPIADEPSVPLIEEAVARAREADCQWVIGFGGGSALDSGKAIAAMLANEGELLDYLEVIGRGKTLSRPSAPFVAIPTTAGTGSEVTRNAVLASPAHRVKVSLRSPLMLPRVALVDPELTYDLPPAVTASTGLDALTQLIEPYVCSRANPMTDAVCVEGMTRAARSLRAAFENGRDAQAREDMAVASLFGGFALANAGLGAAHGFAGPIGGMFPAPHGAVCAALLPRVMAANFRALSERRPGDATLARFDRVARLLTGRDSATAPDGVEWVTRLVADLRIPGLAHYGITREHTAELVEKAGKASSMKANPIALTPAELGGILEGAL
jgi:alcohol dehydrogenase class IV